MRQARTKKAELGRQPWGERVWPGAGVLFLCFFLSGATGLIYEVVWLRMLGLVFGHTVHAVTAVLAAFMGGLALGSALFARRAARMRNLIRAYGWLEIGIGISAALIPTLLGGTTALYLYLQGLFGFSYSTFSFVQFLIVFALLVVPTTLMGGTLPILSQALGRREGSVGRLVGTLYGVNTFGAVVGVVLAGYLFIPALGNRATIAIAAVVNLGLGALVLAYSRSRWAWDSGMGQHAGERPSVESPDSTVGPNTVSPLRGRLGVWLTVGALGISGAVSMLYEVAWTRALALVIGSSTYAFSAMLVAFLGGIAGGSALYAWWGGKRPASPVLFGGLQAGIALAVALVLLGFERMPEMFLAALRWSDSPAFVQLVQLAVSAGTLLLATLLIGATFPCAVAVATRELARVGQAVGRLYAVNTVGAVIGTVLTGFVLIPALGVHAVIVGGIVLNLLLAAALVAVSSTIPTARRWVGATAAVLASAAVLLIPPWDPRVLASGPAVYAPDLLEAADRDDTSMFDLLRREQLVFYYDGLSSTVSVHQNGRDRYLRVNGKTEAGTGDDMPTQLMLGHLPILIHSDPKAVLVIGMGSGVTAGAVARYPVKRLDIVEIEPAVVVAAFHYFGHVNGEVLEDPRVRTIVADGRNFLLTTPEQYDVIISEPSNPWIGGVAALFSVEFFELARQRLRPGGLMVQWVQGYSLLPDDLRMIVKTFRTAFPATSVWCTDGGDYLLLGREEAMPLDLGLFKARFESNRIAHDLERFGIESWPGVLGYFLLGEPDTARFAEAAALNTDDRLSLEFSAPRALYLDTTYQAWESMQNFKTASLPEVSPDSRPELEQPDVLYRIGVGCLSRDALEEALAHFRRALELDPQHTPSLMGMGAVHVKLDLLPEARRFTRQVLEHGPVNADALILGGVAYETLELQNEAKALFQEVLALQPRNAEFRAALSHAMEYKDHGTGL
ncbi:MAG: fused MFS/spermidine synthase [Acidobacteria bacterium]|nr:fused MFS/spermidine synthase [Acidobacteriota bacterium]